MLRVLGSFFGASTHSYLYQVFMASYLVTVLGMETTFIPPVLLIGALAAAVSAFVSGIISDRIGRRVWLLILCAVLAVTPFIAFPLLNTGNRFAIAGVIIFGFVFAAQGITGPQMSFFPELFGSRYRYAGVTVGREFGSVVGGGLAPVFAASLLAWFGGSWVPVAIYMTLVMVVSFVSTYVSPETLNRDLRVTTDAAPGEARQFVNGGWVQRR